MNSFKGDMNFFLDAIINKQIDTPPPKKGKYVVVKHNGRQKMYRINKYGELFEVKK